MPTVNKLDQTQTLVRTADLHIMTATAHDLAKMSQALVTELQRNQSKMVLMAQTLEEIARDKGSPWAEKARAALLTTRGD